MFPQYEYRRLRSLMVVQNKILSATAVAIPDSPENNEIGLEISRILILNIGDTFIFYRLLRVCLSTSYIDNANLNNE